MELLEKRIRCDGRIMPGEILKVDGFLNHRIDPALSYEMAMELKRLYDGAGVNKVLTVEASGIALACMTAYALSCPMVFAKKSRSGNISEDMYSAEVRSYTYGKTYTIVASREYLGPEDKVLIVDDFLATGAALIGLQSLVEQAGGEVIGAGIAIEKAFQGGGDALRSRGMRIESLARIASMGDDGSISFC